MYKRQPLDFLNGVTAADGVGVQYRTGRTQEGSHKSFVAAAFTLLQTRRFHLTKPRAWFAMLVMSAMCTSQITRDPYSSNVFGTGDVLQMVAM